MRDSFASLDTEKKERILKAAMMEFAQSGFDKASTNEIVKGAGISKGLLFHYFKTKKNLFLYLYDYAAEVMTEDFYTRINLNERDFFKKMRHVLSIKLELLERYPDIFFFVQQAYMETSPQIKKEVDKRNSMLLSLNTHQIFGQSDLTDFREAIDLTQALNIIIWTLEGFINQELKKSKFLNQSIDYEKLFGEVEKLIDSIERLFKKEGH